MSGLAAWWGLIEWWQTHWVAAGGGVITGSLITWAVMR